MNIFTTTVEHSISKCTICGKNISNESQFCGSCGHSAHFEDINGTENTDLKKISKIKTPWQHISIAIKLWLFLLALNGALGLTAHFHDISSPFFDFFAQTISAIIIILACIEGRTEIRPLLTNFGIKKYYHLIEVLGAFIFFVFFMWLYLKLMSFIGFNTLNILTDYHQHNWPIWSAFILISICPAVFEELAFRGYIMTKMEIVGSKKEALIIQAVMFSVLHMLPASFISHFILGLIFGVIRISSKSLYPGMLLHAVWNAYIISTELFLS